jgi:pimeloyl-ACP methyl ester carboxylesterase
LASSPTEHHFESFDGVRLAWHELGEGRPLLLIHGLFSSAHVNWIKYGHAALLAGRGFRLIMPDLRAHGESAKPHDAASYPPDVLVRDGLALIANLGLASFDLGGYSLGGRTALRMVVEGATPRRLIVSGMGIRGMLDTGIRTEHFRHILENLGTFERGTPEWTAEAFLKTTRGDPKALLPLLGSFVDTREADLARVAVETLVLSGSEDNDNGSAKELAKIMLHAHYLEVSGNHMNVITNPAFGQAIADFLAA